LFVGLVAVEVAAWDVAGVWGVQPVGAEASVAGAGLAWAEVGGWALSGAVVQALSAVEGRALVGVEALALSGVEA